MWPHSHFRVRKELLGVHYLLSGLPVVAGRAGRGSCLRDSDPESEPTVPVCPSVCRSASFTFVCPVRSALGTDAILSVLKKAGFHRSCVILGVCISGVLGGDQTRKCARVISQHSLSLPVL